jgi:hypothetical protein
MILFLVLDCGFPLKEEKLGSIFIDLVEETVDSRWGAILRCRWLKQGSEPSIPNIK